MDGPDHHPLHDVDEDRALRAIVEGTAAETGGRFFDALVSTLAKTLRTHGAWVTVYERPRRLRSLAFFLGGGLQDEYAYDIAGTPCEPVVCEIRTVHVPERVIELYPDDADLPGLNAVSYLGVPMLDADGSVLGHLAVLDTRPMPVVPRILALVRIFAARAAAEMQRLRAEDEIRRREDRLTRLIDSAMDAIVELDPELRVTRINTAGEKVFELDGGRAEGADFKPLLSAESVRKLVGLMHQLDTLPEGRRYLWVPGGLQALSRSGQPFPAEATLSRFEVGDRRFYTLILRDVNEREQAERKIQELTVETEFLRQELRERDDRGPLVGQSAAMAQVRHDIDQVAATEATVLILGETGTGKELIARAIHDLSNRRKRPLIRVNCAAIPATLIESELFGHEKGAFTGATSRRPGRFVLADGGTIFLDEVGELPLALQPKLLRVLQEGELEPVGSSETRTVDVRVVAATNRDLEAAVAAGEFRADLFYRLNVFPLQVPPLRERSGDVGLLGAEFAERTAHRMGRTLAPLTPAEVARLESYLWPGNVRELENVIERAVITATGDRLNLERALPETAADDADAGDAAEAADDRILTDDELRDRERRNMLKALQAASWKVSGADGAAARVGLPSSTFNSRMRALGIKRQPPP